MWPRPDKPIHFLACPFFIPPIYACRSDAATYLCLNAVPQTLLEQLTELKFSISHALDCQSHLQRFCCMGIGVSNISVVTIIKNLCKHRQRHPNLISTHLRRCSNLDLLIPEFGSRFFMFFPIHAVREPQVSAS